MPAFPRHSVAWQLEHKTTLRRVSLSLPLYGIACGILVRLYRWGVLALVTPEAWGAILIAIAVGVTLMCALATGHLANFTLRSWRWRAPALGALIGAGESVASFVLTLVHQERVGRTIATLGDWPGTALNAVATRTLIVSLFALALAAVVVGLRKGEDQGPSGEDRGNGGARDQSPGARSE
jgi:hypothetical protein